MTDFVAKGKVERINGGVSGSVTARKRGANTNECGKCAD